MLQVGISFSDGMVTVAYVCLLGRQHCGIHKKRIKKKQTVTVTFTVEVTLIGNHTYVLSCC